MSRGFVLTHVFPWDKKPVAADVEIGAAAAEEVVAALQTLTAMHVVRPYANFAMVDGIAVKRLGNRVHEQTGRSLVDYILMDMRTS